MFTRFNSTIKPIHFTKVLARFFSEPSSNQVYLKICKLLKMQYHPFNDEIPKSSTLKLIDEESGMFLGVHSTDSALPVNKENRSKEVDGFGYVQ